MMKKSAFKLSTIKQVWHYIRRYRFLLLLSILFATITVALTLYIPIVIGQAIDLLEGGKGTVNFDAILMLLLRVGVIAIVIAILQ
ncbi:MAG: ABC transporter ATP-binding protein, partial [Clostridia bacterium]|nr:ABC transporter ATP-binding protein [Clostridia bacterium]